MQSFMVRCGKGISAPDLPGQRFQMGSGIQVQTMFQFFVSRRGRNFGSGDIFKICLLIWLHQVFVEALEIFDLCCGMWDLLT